MPIRKPKVATDFEHVVDLVKEKVGHLNQDIAHAVPERLRERATHAGHELTALAETFVGRVEGRVGELLHSEALKKGGRDLRRRGQAHADKARPTAVAPTAVGLDRPVAQGPAQAQRSPPVAHARRPAPKAGARARRNRVRAVRHR